MDIPCFGVGIQHNPEIAGWFPFETQDVPVLEILLDTVMGPLDYPYVFLPGSQKFLERLSAKYRLLAHSNYGCEFGFAKLEETPAVRRHVEIARAINSPWVADHCFYGDGSWVDIWSSPLQFSRAEARRVADRAKMLQSLYGIPLAHENAAYYIDCAGSEIREAAFLADVVNIADTYLLLDLHNLFTNACNHDGYDIDAFLDVIPLERVLEIHLAGGSWHDGLYHDWHDSRIPEPVWELYESVLARSKPKAVILEFQGRAHHSETRVMNFADDAELIKSDIKRAKAIWNKYR